MMAQVRSLISRLPLVRNYVHVRRCSAAVMVRYPDTVIHIVVVHMVIGVYSPEETLTKTTWNMVAVEVSAIQLTTTLKESDFEDICEATLDFLTERLEDMGESDFTDNEFDVNFASGVITLSLGGGKGTYVINKQTPNKQIWLSSPTSGPKRYDYIDGEWKYKHDGSTLYNLLSTELSLIFDTSIDFTPE